MTYVTINERGEASLREWLPTILKYDDPDLDAWIADIDGKFDGSLGFDVSQNIEVGGFHTASGNPVIYTFDKSELDEHEEDSDGERVKCDNCEWTGDVSETEQIADFWSRVDVGGEVPAGDCPKCGAFAYLVKTATVPPADLLKALKAIIAQRDRPHGFPDNDWYEGVFDNGRAAIAQATKG